MKKGLLILLCVAGMALVPACKKEDKKPKVKKEKKVKVKKPKKMKKSKTKKATKKMVWCDKCQKMHAPGLHA